MKAGVAKMIKALVDAGIIKMEIMADIHRAHDAVPLLIISHKQYAKLFKKINTPK